MKKQRPSTAKRGLAVLMSLLMLMTAWVFVAPTASAEGEATFVQDSTGGYVYFNSSASGVSAPTWTEYRQPSATSGVEGQDDIGSWPNMTSGSWTVNGQRYNYRVHINYSDHNNEGGLYITHFYNGNTFLGSWTYTMDYPKSYNGYYY